MKYLRLAKKISIGQRLVCNDGSVITVVAVNEENIKGSPQKIIWFECRDENREVCHSQNFDPEDIVVTYSKNTIPHSGSNT